MAPASSPLIIQCISSRYLTRFFKLTKYRYLANPRIPLAATFESVWNPFSLTDWNGVDGSQDGRQWKRW